MIERALADAAVEVRLGASVVELGVDRVAFAGGEVLDVDIVVVATGPIAAPFRRAPAAPTVFVTGDAAAADTGDGHLALASCQHALQLGRVAGENAARDLRGLELVAYEQLRYVTCLDLGRSSAVLTQGWDREVVLAGPEAKRRKVMINTQVIYPPDGAALDELLRQSALDPADRG